MPHADVRPSQGCFEKEIGKRDTVSLCLAKEVFGYDGCGDGV